VVWWWRCTERKRRERIVYDQQLVQPGTKKCRTRYVRYVEKDRDHGITESWTLSALATGNSLISGNPIQPFDIVHAWTHCSASCDSVLR
jgi:hypothetical protein